MSAVSIPNSREQITLAGLGDTSCGRSLLFCPPEERCLRWAFPGGTVRTISRSRPAARLSAARRGCQGWPRRRRGHRVAARRVLDSSEHRARRTAGGNDSLAFPVLRLSHPNLNPIAVVAPQTEPAVEDRQPAVEILIHLQ